jgi:hypothetical protein
LDYAPKVTVSPTQGGQVVTGPPVSATASVTGVDRGERLPISGTQYIRVDLSGGWRAAAPKVGLSRTGGGNVVSGVLVRGLSQVTGDEASGAVVTGEADQRLEDDLTPRAEPLGAAAAQFKRQADPHGASVFGSNLGRSARVFGSRQRDRAPALESTEGGLPITGSAVGRALRVTGDEDGACLTPTGSQYLSPSGRRQECGGPPSGLAEGRADPASGGKVAVSRTWGGKAVTGANVEHDPRVTGQAPGTCSIITGSPYQGPISARGWCDVQTADAAESRVAPRRLPRTISGDVPVHSSSVTGTGRGADRDITGAVYYGVGPAAEGEIDAAPVASIDAGFSVRSPQRTAHLKAVAPGRITGSFALGEDKITGNTEFLFRPRAPADAAVPARSRITGEGRVEGRVITGDSLADQANVTGVAGVFAAHRNPSLRAGQARAFAGAGAFKAEASTEEPKQLVTGMFGFSSQNAAKVTLSGGAQG